MRYTRAIAGVGLCCVLCVSQNLGGCATTQPYRRQTYVVRPQDTLYSIAWRHDVDFHDLAKWNNIGPDFRLSVGQVLLLQPEVSSGGHRAPAATGPGAAASAAARPAPKSQNLPFVGTPQPLPEPPGGSGAQRPAPGSDASGAGAGVTGAGPGASRGAEAGLEAAAGPAVPAAVGAVAAAGGANRWLWPTERAAPPRPVPGGGILLFGKLGQDVRAASGGRVVYTGSGIRGYGNLIIVKHNGNLLSSYAHNSEMLVHEGQDVLPGQVIAHMGMAAHQTSALYFEIRLNGKPVDPLRYLSAAK